MPQVLRPVPSRVTNLSNLPFVVVFDKLEHLPIRTLYWQAPAVGTGTAKLTVELATCDAYAQACEVLGLVNDGGRMLRDHKVFDQSTRDGVTVIEHRCYPHMDCWGQR